MKLSCTVFEILSLILQRLKRSRDSDQAPFMDSLSSVDWDLLRSTFSPNNLSRSMQRYLRATKDLKWVTWRDHMLTSGTRLSSVAGTCYVQPAYKIWNVYGSLNEDNAKCKNSRFEPPFGRLRGNAQGSSMARWKAHCRLPISDWTFFANSHGWGTIKRNLSKLALSGGVGHFERKFQLDGDVSRNPFMGH